MAYPHFCGADPVLAEGVEGLQCRPEYLDLFIDVGESWCGSDGRWWWLWGWLVCVDGLSWGLYCRPEYLGLCERRGL